MNTEINSTMSNPAINLFGSRERMLRIDFRKLWLGETVSLFGDQIMLLVFPLIALNICRVSTALSVLLPLALNFPFLVLGLPVGVIIERISAKKMMVVSDLISGAMFGIIWTLIEFHHLHYVYLMSLAGLTGCVKVFFQVSYASYLPRVIQSEKLLHQANAKLALSESSSLSIGPMLGTAVLSIIGIGQLVGINALSFIVSALSVASMKISESPSVHQHKSKISHLISDIIVGLRYVLAHPLLFPIISCGTVYVLFLSMVDSIMVLYCLQVLHIPVHMIGVIIGASALGFPVGNMISVRLSDILGKERALLCAAIISVSGIVSMPIFGSLGGHSGMVGLIGASIIHCLGEGAFNPLALTLRQVNAPVELLSRVVSIQRTLIWGAITGGSLLAASATYLAGLSSAMWLGGIGTIFCLPCLYSQGIRKACAHITVNDPDGR